MKQFFRGASPRVVAAGECMLELARQGELWRLGAAGDSFNTALYLQRLGAKVRYFPALGRDPFSEEMLHSWAREGLDTSLVLRDPERLPGLYAIRTDDQGERSFYYWRQNAAARQLFRQPGIDAMLQAAADCDLLYLTGVDLRGQPLETRKQALRKLKLPTDRGRMRFGDHLVGDGPQFVAEAERRGLEGIVSKRRDQPYRAGRSLDWRKIKSQQRAEFVSGGYTDPSGSRPSFGALSLS